MRNAFIALAKLASSRLTQTLIVAPTCGSMLREQIFKGMGRRVQQVTGAKG